MNKYSILITSVIVFSFVSCKKTTVEKTSAFNDPSSQENLVASPVPFAGNVWQIRAGFPPMVLRSGACSFVIGNKSYVFGGYAGGFKRDLWEYDPSTNKWTAKADLPLPGKARTNAVAFTVNGKGYVTTGDVEFSQAEGYNVKDLWEYDPALNRWLRKKDLPGNARGRAVGFAIGSKGYVATGGNEQVDGMMDDVWKYTPATDTWTSKGKWTKPGDDMGRYHASAFVIGNKAYVGTGFGASISAQFNCMKDFWEYDPAANTWTQKADFGGGYRTNADGMAAATTGYIGLGYYIDPNNGNFFDTKDFWSYNPTTNVWTKRADFPGVVRSSATAFFINGYGYMGLGTHNGNSSTNDFYRYMP